MKVIGIVNQKGGTGKTTTAVNLSSGLAYQNKDTLLIDLDPQGHSTIGLGIEPPDHQHSISQVLDHPDTPLEDVVVSTYIPHLFVVPSHISLARTAEQMYSRIYKEATLQRLLAPLTTTYEYVLIDCPPSLGVLTVNALFAADSLIVPCQISRYSLDGLSDLMDIIRAVKEHDSTKGLPPYVHILITMFDVRNRVTNEFILKQLEPLDEQVFRTRIMKNEALNQAQIAQKAIFDYDARSRGAQNYQELTKELLQYG